MNQRLQDARGSVFAIVAFSMLAVVGSTGLAIDVGRSQMVQSKLQSAVDSAALAVGATVSTANLTALASKYVNVNFSQGTMGATLTSVTATANADNTVVTVTAQANMPTTIMKVFGQTALNLSARSEVTRANKGLELALVLDITGSMWSNNNYLEQRSAAAQLVDILYGSRDTVENMWVSVIPYVTSVNIGNQSRALNWLTDATLTTSTARYPTGYPSTYPKWKGCVEERATPYDTTDDPPVSGTQAAQVATRWNPFYWANSTADNHWNNGSTITINEAINYQNNTGLGPNISCGDPVLPLTASKTTVLNKINSLYPWRKGGTMSNVGLAWGWRMLSPRWRGLWDADLVNGQARLPLDYNTPLMQKVVVIETDGANNFFKSASTTPPYSDYTAMLRLNTTANGGRSDINTQSNATGITILNNKTLAICTAMKQQGILIYTITFGLGNSTDDNNARALFRSCASQPSYYFDARSGTGSGPQVDLTTAFQQIGDALANLRISR